MEGLVCKRSYLAVIGCILKDSSLLSDLDKPLDRADFNTDDFYELIFVAIKNLYDKGCLIIDEFAVDSYLSAYPVQYKIFQDNEGLNYLISARDIADLTNYNYFYHRLRKYSLLRYYESKGLDTRTIYNSTLTDSESLEKEQNKFDSYTEQDIIEMVENIFITLPTMSYCTNTLTTDKLAGDGLDKLVDELMETPDVGLPLVSEAMNTITRGARKGCLYMRSAPTSGGKSRFSAGDACKFAVPYIWDLEKSQWEYTGLNEPTLYITTEMTIDEVQTLVMATISGVNEEHILNGEYEEGELERVRQANQYIESSPFYICHIPDFSIEDIKNVVKRYHREHHVDYFFFDYIHTSLRLMSEIGGKSRMSLKEHQLLVVFVTELKALCQQLDIFMMTSSQCNGTEAVAPIIDQNCLMGAKALAIKLDIGVICCKPRPMDIKKIEPIVAKMVNVPMPNMLTWVYKVRRGRITRVILHQFVDLGTMRTKDLFVTTTDFKLIEMDFTKIEHINKVIKENSIKISDAVFVDTDTGEILEDSEEENNENVKKIVGW